MVPFYALDFKALTSTTAEELDFDNELYFDPSVVQEALDAVLHTMMQPDLPADRVWMIDPFREAVDKGVVRQQWLAFEDLTGPEQR